MCPVEKRMPARRLPSLPALLAALGLWLSLGLWAGGARAAERAIDKAVLVNAPVEAVWAAWTTREGIVSFFAPDAEIDARVGGAFHIHIDPLAAPGAKGADDMRFLALQPPRMLSFDWNAPPHLAEARTQRTFVIVRLAPADGGQTRVSLHHTGWGDGGQWDQAHAYFDKAWGGVLGNLKKRFETGPQDWTAWLAQLKQYHDEADAKARAAKPG
jgi:uncharacterized protein YndB with AHSA1/START domain